jgi:hypothetical protein
VEHPDLHLFPDGQLPGPYNRPILIVKVGQGFLPRGLRLCSVGWLEQVGFPTGPEGSPLAVGGVLRLDLQPAT